MAPSPGDPSARAVAEGRSTLTGRAFNLMVAAERKSADDGRLHGRIVAHSSFHQVAADRHALDDIKAYVRNAVRCWRLTPTEIERIRERSADARR